MSEVITADRLRREAFSYYAVLLLWPLYLCLLPVVFAESRWWWTAAFMLFPGVYLFTWAGFLMHESWHRYMPNISNQFFYNAFALLILTDPQLYHLLHGSHHGQAHTYMDAEFHPLGEIKSRKARIVYNWMEFILGIAFLIAAASWAIPRDPRFAQRYRRGKLVAAFVGWVVLLGGLGLISHQLFGVTAGQIAASYVLTFWLGSFVLHQSQLIEHGNLIIQGSAAVRAMGTRNLNPSGFLEKAFLLLTHNEAQDHVVHHTHPNVNSRPFPDAVAMPQEAVKITFTEYVPLITRMLKGEVERVIVSDEKCSPSTGNYALPQK